MPVKLGDVADLFVGLQTDADDIYILEQIQKEGEKVLCYSKATGKRYWLEDEHLKPFLKGSLNIHRYHLTNVSKRLIFPYELREGKSTLIDSEKYEKKWPLTWAYLQENRARLSYRNKGKIGHDWYGYVYKKNHTRFGMSKLLVPSIALGSSFTSDLEGNYHFVGSGGGGGGGYGIVLIEDEKISLLYLLGLLNSNLLSDYLQKIATTFRGGYIALNKQYIEQLPIRMIDFAKPADRERHNQMVSLVESMLSLHKQLAVARTEHESTNLRRQIDATNRRIDRLVYDLYDLTDDEVTIVEKDFLVAKAEKTGLGTTTSEEQESLGL